MNKTTISDFPERRRDLVTAVEESTKLIVQFSVIGVLIGGFVLALYGLQHNVIAGFSGDEWIPQLATVGLFCGLFVASLAFIATTDILFQRVVAIDSGKKKVEEIDAPEKVQAAANKPPLRQVFVVDLVFSALMLLAMALSIHAVSIYPIVIIVGVVLLTSLVEFLLQDTARVSALFQSGSRLKCLRSYWSRVRSVLYWLHLSIACTCSFFVVCTVALLMVSRSTVSDERCFWISASIAALAVSLFRLVARKVLQDKSVPGYVQLLASCVVTLAIAAWFSPEIVRAAGFGNLTSVHLLMDADTACAIARRLQIDESARLTYCSTIQESAVEKTIEIQVDLVSRLGSLYTLAAPNSFSNDVKCSPIGNTRLILQEPHYIPCVEVPRDTVKLLNRPLRVGARATK